MRSGFVAVVALSGMTIAAGAASGQDTIRACVKVGQGQIRIIDSSARCLPSEKLVEWSLGGGGASPAGLGTFRVVDSLDTVVGTVLGGSNIAVPVGSEWVAFPMESGGPRGTPTFWFATPCPAGGPHQGEPSYMAFAGNPLYKEGLAMGTTVYYPGAANPSFVPASYEGDPYGMGVRACYDIPAGFAPNYRFGPTQTLDLSGLAPPFRLVLR